MKMKKLIYKAWRKRAAAAFWCHGSGAAMLLYLIMFVLGVKCL
jgi:hypothetical protein